jgi:hypothetical protein
MNLNQPAGFQNFESSAPRAASPRLGSRAQARQRPTGAARTASPPNGPPASRTRPTGPASARKAASPPASAPRITAGPTRKPGASPPGPRKPKPGASRRPAGARSEFQRSVVKSLPFAPVNVGQQSRKPAKQGPEPNWVPDHKRSFRVGQKRPPRGPKRGPTAEALTSGADRGTLDRIA